jgi:hypothetical protein
MNCPKCNAWTRVAETRLPFRVRECGNLHRFTTEEQFVFDHEDKQQLHDEKRRMVAAAEGTIQSVANRFNVSVHSVNAWRKKYRETK